MNYRHEWKKNRLQYVPPQGEEPPWLLGKIRVLAEGIDDFGSRQSAKTRKIHVPEEGLVLIGSAIDMEIRPFRSAGKTKRISDFPESWAWYTDAKGRYLYLIDRDRRP